VTGVTAVQFVVYLLSGGVLLGVVAALSQGRG
jgi:hypothetical protein